MDDDERDRDAEFIDKFIETVAGIAKGTIRPEELDPEAILIISKSLSLRARLAEKLENLHNQQEIPEAVKDYIFQAVPELEAKSDNLNNTADAIGKYGGGLSTAATTAGLIAAAKAAAGAAALVGGGLVGIALAGGIYLVLKRKKTATDKDAKNLKSLGDKISKSE